MALAKNNMLRSLPAVTCSVFLCRIPQICKKDIRNDYESEDLCMSLNTNWNRRTFIGGLATIAAAVAAPLKALGWNRGAAQTDKVSGFGSTGNVYEELGVTTVINCEGTMTTLGG